MRPLDQLFGSSFAQESAVRHPGIERREQSEIGLPVILLVHWRWTGVSRHTRAAAAGAIGNLPPATASALRILGPGSRKPCQKQKNRQKYFTFHDLLLLYRFSSSSTPRCSSVLRVAGGATILSPRRAIARVKLGHHRRLSFPAVFPEAGVCRGEPAFRPAEIPAFLTSPISDVKSQISIRGAWQRSWSCHRLPRYS